MANISIGKNKLELGQQDLPYAGNFSEKDYLGFWFRGNNKAGYYTPLSSDSGQAGFDSYSLLDANGYFKSSTQTLGDAEGVRNDIASCSTGFHREAYNIFQSGEDIRTVYGRNYEMNHRMLASMAPVVVNMTGFKSFCTKISLLTPEFRYLKAFRGDDVVNNLELAINDGTEVIQITYKWDAAAETYNLEVKSNGHSPFTATSKEENLGLLTIGLEQNDDAKIDWFLDGVKHTDEMAGTMTSISIQGNGYLADAYVLADKVLDQVPTTSFFLHDGTDCFLGTNYLEEV